jgi:hypothetical protein
VSQPGQKSESIKVLNVRSKTLKIIIENRQTVEDISIGKYFVNITPVAQV